MGIWTGKAVDSLVLISGEDLWDSRLNANPYFEDIFRFPGFLKKFSGDVSLFNRDMMALYNSSVYFFIIRIASQIFFALSLWSFLRISRWPVINRIYFLLGSGPGAFLLLISLWDR